jgi:5-methylcytosine-specific restriction endonuclease McrA
MNCEYCGREHNGAYASGRFCDKRCSARYADSKVKVRHGFLGERRVDKANETKRIKRESLLKTMPWEGLSRAEKERHVLRDQNNKCNICTIELWCSKVIILEFHHKDGNKKNEARENLEYLCPNCHSQTDNFRFRHKHHTEESKKKCHVNTRHHRLIC